jgi:uncharacterized repeat protein (TIGR01451 family)
MTMQRRGRFISTTLALCVSLTALSRPASASDYTITDLGANFQPLSVNESGLISGIDPTSGTPTAVLYQNKTLIPLQSQSYALDVNESGLVAGYADNTPYNQALLWDNGQLSSELGQFSNLLEARSLSSFDEVVGVRLNDDGFRRAFYYDIYTGNLLTLATLGGAEGWANSINDVGQITGAAMSQTGESLSFRYDGRQLIKMDPFSGYKNSEGNDINDKNAITGIVYNRNNRFSGIRAVYAPQNLGLSNLGSINNDIDSIAKGLNNNGFIVGQSVRVDGLERAFFYDTAADDTQIISTDPGVPTTVYIGSTTGAGISRSVNRGQDWNTINFGLGNGEINEITVHPDDSSRVFASTKGGIYVSSDSGASWKLIKNNRDDNNDGINDGITDIPVNTVYIDNKDTSLMLAGTNGGIYYSTDGGSEWYLADETSSFGTFAFIGHPTENLIFAATSNGVYRSIDNGESWDQNNGQDPNQLFTRFVSSLAIDPNDPDTLYIGTFGGGAYRTLPPSQPSGTSPLGLSLQWEQYTDGIELNTVYALTVDDSTAPSTFYAATGNGLYSRTTADEKWTAVDFFRGSGTYSMSLADETTRHSLYVTTVDGRIFRSDDESSTLASTWTSISRSVASSDVYAFSVIPDINSSKSRILAGTANGVFSAASNDAAADANWTVAKSGTSGFKIATIAFDDRTTPPLIWAGSSDKGLYLSTDNGDTWLSSNNGMENRNIQSIRVDTTTTPPIVYAATLGGVYRSLDGGINWSVSNNGLGSLSVYSLVLDTVESPHMLYAGTADGIYRSSDQGRNWVPVNIGLENTDIVDLEINPGSNPDDHKTVVAASASRGLWRTDDQGQSWTELNDTGGLNDTTIFDIAQDPNNPGTFITGTSSGVYQLTGGFESVQCSTTITTSCWEWSAINTGLATTTIFAVAYNPDDLLSNELFAGSAIDGAYKSADGGTTWETMSNGLSSLKNKMVSINSLLNDSTWDLQDATSIDNQGRIVGSGLHNGKLHGYLLEPAVGTEMADLSVKARPDPKTLKAGIPMSYEITVTNNGPEGATDVQLTDWLPPNILFRHVSSSQGACQTDESAPVIRCSLDNLTVGDHAYVSIFAEPEKADLKLRNIVRVKANEQDPDFSNNTNGANSSITVDRCFIATAAYGSFLDPHVSQLRDFRDRYLLGNSLGRYLVKRYYEYSPPLARLISEHESLRMITRLLLAPIVYAIAYPLWFAVVVTLLGTAWVYRYRRSRFSRVTVNR